MKEELEFLTISIERMKNICEDELIDGDIVMKKLDLNTERIEELSRTVQLE